MKNSGVLYRYQIRIGPGESFFGIRNLLADKIKNQFRNRLDWGELSSQEIVDIADHTRRVFNRFIAVYHFCGTKAGCFELADPAGLCPPHPGLVNLRAWEGVGILHIEVKNDIQEFFTALEVAVFRAIGNTSARHPHLSEIKEFLEKIIFDIFGPRLFRAANLNCDLCGILKRTKPQRLVCGKMENKQNENND
ncbi:MAG: hypothetical protein ACYCPQ_11210 [Elusimicrobiota bacterium]